MVSDIMGHPVYECSHFSENQQHPFYMFIILCLHLSLVMRKPVFGVFDQVRLKLACSATEAR